MMGAVTTILRLTENVRWSVAWRVPAFLLVCGVALLISTRARLAFWVALVAIAIVAVHYARLGRVRYAGIVLAAVALAATLALAMRGGPDRPASAALTGALLPTPAMATLISKHTFLGVAPGNWTVAYPAYAKGGDQIFSPQAIRPVSEDGVADVYVWTAAWPPRFRGGASRGRAVG
jgi:hypothetical protein